MRKSLSLILLLFLPLSLSATIAYTGNTCFVTSPGNVTTSTTSSCGTVPAGALVVVAIGTSTTTTTTVTDSAAEGNFTQAGATQTNGSSGWTSRLYYFQNSAGGAAFTVTVTNGTTCLVTVVVGTFSGAATTSALDQSAGTTGNSATPGSGNVTPGQNNELITGAVGWGNTAAATATSPFTLVASQGVGGTNVQEALEYNVQTTATTTAAAFGIPSTQQWSSNVATFKVPSASASTLASPFVISP